MPEPLEVHVCEECGQTMFEVCSECEGSGTSLAFDMYGHLDCDRCGGTGWAEKDCDCPKPERKPYPRMTLDQILAKHRKHKESA